MLGKENNSGCLSIYKKYFQKISKETPVIEKVGSLLAWPLDEVG